MSPMCTSTTYALEDNNRGPDSEQSAVALTGVRRGALGSACEVTGALSLALALEVAVDGIRAVRPHCIGLEARTLLVDRSAVSPSSACIVQSLLQHWIWQPSPASTPSSSTYSRTDRKLCTMCLRAFSIALETWNVTFRETEA